LTNLQREPYVEVRSQLASSARRLPASQCLPIVRALLARSEDVEDIHIPLLLWWAIESKAGSDRDAVIALFGEPAVWELPIVRQHVLSRVMRRYAASGSRQDLLACAKLLQLAPNKELSAELMKGFEEAFQGRSLAALPEELAAAIGQRQRVPAAPGAAAEAGGGRQALATTPIRQRRVRAARWCRSSAKSMCRRDRSAAGRLTSATDELLQTAADVARTVQRIRIAEACL
jgi:hypothetical protein